MHDSSRCPPQEVALSICSLWLYPRHPPAPSLLLVRGFRPVHFFPHFMLWSERVYWQHFIPCLPEQAMLSILVFQSHELSQQVSHAN